SRAISKKTYTNFCPQTGSSTGLTEFLTIPSPNYMGCSEGYRPITVSIANEIILIDVVIFI
ncbi:hypothetical protein U3A58_21615, partial [Algoriphagus sp. C2-6-M1]|uniref:hypothetical protein n=1 Tax=Algoriphagus persicinus TaxID=3108754 RepID=UPI002B38F138